jgi:starch synthase
MSDPLRVLFLVAEAAPFIKVGGLGDVGGSLPPALHRARDGDLDIRLVIPHHAGIALGEKKLHKHADVPVKTRKGKIPATVHSLRFEGVTVYLIGGEPITASPAVYMSDPRLDGRKFTFFSLAALELARHLNWAPDILHANDWHTAPAITALHTRYKQDPFFEKTRSALTLHNLPYMGDGSCYPEFNLDGDPATKLPEWAREKPLPLGLLHADRIVAVSPSYAQGILTEPFACGLGDFLTGRRRDLHGILNGLDYDLWNPETDKFIDQNFSDKSLPQRQVNKTALLESLGLPLKADAALLGMVSRLDPQKGIDLAFDSLRSLEDPNWHFILVGTGNPELENAARKLQADFPDQVWVVLRYDDGMARQVYAGADLLLMPSRYEPCGLAQMIAMRYGCLPVATPVGGLQDTIVDPQNGRGQTGFVSETVSQHTYNIAIARALKQYRDASKWQSIQKRAMKQNFSWEKSAEKYLKLYHSLTGK